MVETSSYSSEFIALKTATEHIKGIRNSLRSLGIEVKSPTLIRCDNRSVVCNNVRADSTLRNRAIGIAYHLCRECIAAGITEVKHIKSQFNRSDILIKILAKVMHGSLTKRIFFTQTKSSPEREEGDT